MVVSFISISKGYLKNSLINKASKFLDEKSNDVRNTIDCILTILYAKIADTSFESKESSKDLYDLITASHFSNLNYVNLEDIFSGENSLLINESNNVLNFLWEDKIEELAYLVGENYEIHKESSLALFKMVLPVVIGSVNEVIHSKKINAKGFNNLLKTQKKYISYNNISPFLTKKLVSDYNLSLLKNTFEEVIDEKEKMVLISFKNVLTIIGFFLFLGASYYFVSYTTEKEKPKQKENKVSRAEILRNTVYDTDLFYNPTEKELGKYIEKYEFLGCFVKRELKNKVQLIVLSDGAEANLINFIESKASIKDSKWFPLRRVIMDEKTNTLSKKSVNQINNIVQILKTYPNVHIVIGGYSYSKEGPVKNFEKSYRFAEKVAKKIINDGGINKERIRFEGYGNKYQVKQGVKMAKRVGIKVVKKHQDTKIDRK